MAKNLLRKLKPEEYFYLHDGTIIKSIMELSKRLKTLDQDTFRYHLNPETNDFANWIKFLSDDMDLMMRVEKCIKKEELIRIINEEITSLRKVAAAIKKAKLPAKPIAVEKEKAIVLVKKKAIQKKAVKKAPVKEKAVEAKKTEYITSGIREYLLGIITGLILGLIIGSVI